MLFVYFSKLSRLTLQPFPHPQGLLAPQEMLLSKASPPLRHLIMASLTLQLDSVPTYSQFNTQISPTTASTPHLEENDQN